jgi:hypothetical protein
MKHSSSKKIRDQRSETITPVTASPATDAEFCDSPGAFQRFGLRRSLLYELNNLGLIKGVSLRRRGAVRGKRLWSCDSIRRYLAAQMESSK